MTVRSASLIANAARRRLAVVVLVVLAFVAVGCGGEDGDGAGAAPEPTIPSVVAQRLAEQSDAVAGLAAAGDECGAAIAADELDRAVQQASGHIPMILRDELDRTVRRLVDELNCPTPPPQEDEGKPDRDEGKPDKDEDRKGEDGKGEDGKRGDGGGPGHSENAPGHKRDRG